MERLHFIFYCLLFRKYYFEVKRLEDGFDLSGPDCPRLDHPPLKAVSFGVCTFFQMLMHAGLLLNKQSSF